MSQTRRCDLLDNALGWPPRPPGTVDAPSETDAHANMHRHPFTQYVAALLAGRTRSILVNGLLSPAVVLHSSVSQGCSVAVFAFLVYVEPMARLLILHVPGIALDAFDKTALPVLQFADDILLIILAKWLPLALDIIDIYCAATCMATNLGKSLAFFSVRMA